MTKERLRDRIVELGPWFQPFTLNGWNTWELAPHPVYIPDPVKAEARWGRIRETLPERLDGWRILDVGCAEGYLATKLAGIGAAVDAIDVWEPMVRKAELVAEVLDADVWPRLGTAYEIDGRYDLVVMSNVMSMFKDPLAALRRAAAAANRLLVWAAISDDGQCSGKGWIPTRNGLEDALHAAGFTSLARADKTAVSAIYIAER